MPPIRIALVGAHGTGKTTLSRVLSEHLQDLGLKVMSLPEVPRLLCSEAGDPVFFRRGNNSPLRQSLILLGHAIYELLSLKSDVDVVISDRALLDHWAYTVYLFSEELREAGVFDLYESLVVTHCQAYDAIVFIPIEFPVVDDGTREDDAAFQSGIQSTIHRLLESRELTHTTIKGSVEERLKAAASLILNLINHRASN